MSNLNKIYHKGKYRSGEWAKHLRPYLKRKGNKRFRKKAVNLEQEEFERYLRFNCKKGRKRIKAKITIEFWRGSKVSYYRNYRTMKDFENAVKRPNVINFVLLS